MTATQDHLKEVEERNEQIIDWINAWVEYTHDETSYTPTQLYDVLFPPEHPCAIARSNWGQYLKFLDNLRFFTWTRPQTPPKANKGRPPIPEEERDRKDRPMKERLYNRCHFILQIEYDYGTFTYMEKQAGLDKLVTERDAEPQHVNSVRILAKDG